MVGKQIVAPNTEHHVSQEVITSYNPPTLTEREDNEPEPWQHSAAWQDLLSYDGDRIGGAL